MCVCVEGEKHSEKEEWDFRKKKKTRLTHGVRVCIRI